MRKFDREQPYVFISYTKADKELVYPFVERLRESGANVWMDDLLGRRAGSWVTDVLPLVVDENRVLTLYFRSKSSLVNKNVYQEIEKSIRVSGDKSVHIVDLYPHQENADIYTELYKKRDTIETFMKMVQYIAEEANAYLYNDESDFSELLENLKELGVIIQDKAIAIAVPTPEKNVKINVAPEEKEEAVAEVKPEPQEIPEEKNQKKKHAAVNVKKGEKRPEVKSYPANITKDMTLSEFEKLFDDVQFVLHVAYVREHGDFTRQFMDYVMSALLRGCDKKAVEQSARWNYCTYAVATLVDMSNPDIGASQFTWQSNSRKAVNISGSGKLGSNSVIFENLSADLTLGDVEQMFKDRKEGFDTKDNSVVEKVFAALYDIK